MFTGPYVSQDKIDEAAAALAETKKRRDEIDGERRAIWKAREHKTDDGAWMLERLTEVLVDVLKEYTERERTYRVLKSHARPPHLNWLRYR